MTTPPRSAAHFRSAHSPTERNRDPRADRDYTYLHAVAETAAWPALFAARFVKAAARCSAPPEGSGPRPGTPGEDEADPGGPDTTPGALRSPPSCWVSHPNYSGLQMGPAEPPTNPGRLHADARVSYNWRSVFRLESDISTKRGPRVNFSFRPATPEAPGVLTAEILDSNQRRFTQSWPVPAAPQM